MAEPSRADASLPQPVGTRAQEWRLAMKGHAHVTGIGQTVLRLEVTMTQTCRVCSRKSSAGLCEAVQHFTPRTNGSEHPFGRSEFGR